MPAKSRAQFRFFEALAHNPELAKKHNITQEKAKEYISKNKGKYAFHKLKDKVSKKD